LESEKGDLNIEHNFLIIKGEEQASKIKYCEYVNGKYKVTFSEGKTYSYLPQNVIWIRKPIRLDPDSTIVSQKNQPMSNISKIFIFEDKYIRLIFKNGYQKAYRKNELKIEKNCINEKKTGNCLAYLKELTEAISTSNNEGEIGFLSKQYEQITQIEPNSIFALFLDPKPIKASKSTKQPIFPFGFNLSQKKACQDATGNQLCIIEGPPGTGKTQTILNIIANAIMMNQTVAVVSNNNSATANVLEKLQKYGVDYIAAYLGNNENQENFFKDQSPDYPDVHDWGIEEQEAIDLKKQLDDQGKMLDDMLEMKNRAAILKQDLSEVLTESLYFQSYDIETNDYPIKYKSLYRQTSSAIMKLWIEYHGKTEQGRMITVIDKLKYLLRFGIYDFKFYNNPEERILSLFQKLFYDYKINELNEEIVALSKKLYAYNFEQVMSKYSEDSMRLFKSHLAGRYSSSHRAVFTKEILNRDVDQFLKEYPVILSTTHSIKRCASANYKFDYLIMDESTQVDLVTGALALSCAKKAVIVGDLKQLPNVVPSDIKETTDRIFNKYNLPEAYRYSSNSILSSLLEMFQKAPKTMLKEHYRCHPKIIGFCNKKYYNNDLIILTEDKGEEQPLLLYKTAKGNHARGNLNQRQIDVIFNEIIPDQHINESQSSVGIISPYRLQAEELQRLIGNSKIEADTVHKFQGREKDIVILSTVANDINEFVDNPNLLNVAVSRAAKRLIVVASGDVAESNSNIGDLVGYIRYNNFEVKESKIYSVFDLLYRCYSKLLLEYMANNKAGAIIPSEILLNELLDKVLGRAEHNHLDMVLHQPLRMLIRDPALLDDAECKFAMNINTHTDFLIFNKFDKSPVLVIEVDGFFYHADNPRQLERDKMKDVILQKYNIPILRLPTNGSGEEEKICKRLAEIETN
jgi:hypothetical protein